MLSLCSLLKGILLLTNSIEYEIIWLSGIMTIINKGDAFVKINTIKRITVFFITLILLLSFSGCSNTESVFNSDDNKLVILCTTFPQYDWVCNIIGDSGRLEASLLLDDGTEMHSFQPSADDIIRINNSDLFIYNGGESDAALEDILDNNKNENQIIVNLMNTLNNNILYEDHIHDEDCDHSEDENYDEHIWLSLKNAAILCRSIADKIKVLDPENAVMYEENVNTYISSLNDLDSKYESVVQNSKRNEIIFVDRFPFKYMMNDYSLSYSAAFPGCSTETDASFNTIVFLAKKIDEIGNNMAVTLENSSSSISVAVNEATECKNLEILTMNSMQTVTGMQIADGLTYLNVMEENLNTLQKILN